MIPHLCVRIGHHNAFVAFAVAIAVCALVAVLLTAARLLATQRRRVTQQQSGTFQLAPRVLLFEVRQLRISLPLLVGLGPVIGAAFDFAA